MRDHSLTIAEAAAWLKCSEAEVQEHLRAGRLRPYQQDPQNGGVSLNAVVVLAESLPPDHRIFEVREPAARSEHPSSDMRGPYPARSGGGPDQRPGLIVERRSPRPFSR